MTDKSVGLPVGKGPIDIVRYANRKLYVESHGYIDMPFLQECVKNERPIVVRNHSTGQDETAIVLGRMLMHAAKEQKAPVERMQHLLSEIYGEPVAASPS